MNMNNTTIKNNNEETIVENILERLDQGASLSQLADEYKAYPEAVQTVRLFVEKTDLIKEHVFPDRRVVAHVLHDMHHLRPSPLQYTTKLLAHGYDYIFTMMKNILKIGLPVLAIALIIIGVQIHNKNGKTALTPFEKEQARLAEGTITPPKATGNIDDIVTSLEQADKEEAAVAAQGDDAALSSDSDIITNYDTTYDQAQF
jgi:hypothetical protein